MPWFRRTGWARRSGSRFWNSPTRYFLPTSENYFSWAIPYLAMGLDPRLKAIFNESVTKTLKNADKIRRSARLNKEAMHITDDRAFGLGYLQGYMHATFVSMLLMTQSRMPVKEEEEEFDSLMAARMPEIQAAMFD